jgi:HD superfamily phosphodiesterase
MDNIIKSSSEFVTKLLNENLPSGYTYHNLLHTCEVFEAVTELGKNSSLLDEELEIIQIAAWFHDTGFIRGYVDHECKSIKIVKEFLENIRYPEEKLVKVTNNIRMTDLEKIPANLSEKIIRDADILHLGKKDFYSRSLSLRAEWESIDCKKFTDAEWLHSSLDFIIRTSFFTDYAISKYEAERQKNITRLTEMVKNLNNF